MCKSGQPYTWTSKTKEICKKPSVSATLGFLQISLVLLVKGVKTNFLLDQLKTTLLLLGKILQVFGTSNCHLCVISLPSHAKN